MAAPGIAADPPPPYSFVPSSEELFNLKKSKLVGEDSTYKYTVSTFQTNAKKSGSNEPLVSWGTLDLGVKHPHGILQQVCVYKPSRIPGAGGDWVIGKECDISDSTVGTKVGPSMKYVKHFDSVTPSFRFDITVKDFGTSAAQFSGTMECGKVKYDWYGDWSTDKDVTKEFEKLPTTPPAHVEGTMEELHQITPTQWVTDSSTQAEDTASTQTQSNGATKKPGEDKPVPNPIIIKQVRVDGAQQEGDKLMNNIMMHALDQSTRDHLLPNLEKNYPLDALGQELLRDNHDFLYRGGIHLMADQLIEMPGVDKEIKDGIKPLYKKYMDMLSTPAPQAQTSGAVQPVSADGKPKKDPVVSYGWDPVKDAARLEKLRKQYQTVSLRCYLEGYKKQCPEWQRFLKEPEYWFNAYSEFLMSPDHIRPWQVSLANPPADAIPVHQQILLWTNKLSMLKYATSEKQQDALDIEKITVNLTAESQMALSYNQLVDEDLLRKANNMYERLDNEPQSVESKAKLEKILETRSSYSEVIDRSLREEGIAVLSNLANQNSKLAIETASYWENRLPPGATRAEPGRMTVGQIIAAWDEGKAAEARLRELRKADNFPPLEDGPRKSLLDKIKDSKGPLVRLFKGTLHTVAFICLVGELALPGLKSGDQLEVARTACTLTAELLNAVGWLSRKVLNWLWGKGRVFTGAIGWFTDAIKTEPQTLFKNRVTISLVGSIGKIIRAIGIVGCVCGIVLSYWDMKKAEQMGDDGKRFLWYSRITFALGCFEALVGITSIAAEIFSWITCATICGPLGIAIGVAMLVGAMVYYFAFRPDPMADVKQFLRGEGREMGSYTGD